MFTGIFAILFVLSSTACGLSIRQNLKIRVEYNKLRATLLDTINGDLDVKQLLTSGDNRHDWELFDKTSYTFNNNNNQHDTLRSFECKDCGLIKRLWTAGHGNTVYKGKRMDGLFRLGNRLNDVADEFEVPCRKKNRATTTDKLFLLK